MTNNTKLNPHAVTTRIMLYFMLFSVISWIITALINYSSNVSHSLEFQIKVLVFVPWIVLLIFTIFIAFAGKFAVRNALLFVLVVWLYGYVDHFFRFYSYLQLAWYYEWSITYTYNFLSFFISNFCLFWIISTVLTQYTQKISSLKKQCIYTVILFIGISIGYGLIYRCIFATLFPTLLQSDSLSLIKLVLYTFIPNITWLHLANFLLSITIVSAQVKNNQSTKLFKPAVTLEKLSLIQIILLFISLLVAVPLLILGLFYAYVYGIHQYAFSNFITSPSYVISQFYMLMNNYKIIYSIFFLVNACCITLLWKFAPRRAYVFIYTLFSCSSLYFTVIGWIRELNGSSRFAITGKTGFISFDLVVQLLLFTLTLIGYLIVLKIWRKVEI